MVEGATLSAGARARIEHEANLLSKVQSPWLNRVIAFGQEENRLYLVQPWVQGIILRQRISRAPLGLQDVLGIGRCLFSALKEVHSLGVLHHDIRPANLILSDRPPPMEAVLTGFGLGCCDIAGTLSVQESMEAAFYRSPEQAGSVDHDVGAMSDLYSAGIVLFECLAGRVPYGGDTVGAVLLSHMTSPVPDLRATGVGIPRSLDELLQRLLRKDPCDRYQTAEAVLFDLEGIAASLHDGRRNRYSSSACTIVNPRLPSRRSSATRTNCSRWKSRFGKWSPDNRDPCFWRPSRAEARRGSWPKSPCAACKRCGCCTAAGWKWWGSDRSRYSMAL